MGVSKNRGTPVHHPFLDGICHEINHVFWCILGYLYLWKPPYIRSSHANYGKLWENQPWFSFGDDCLVSEKDTWRRINMEVSGYHGNMKGSIMGIWWDMIRYDEIWWNMMRYWCIYIYNYIYVYMYNCIMCDSDDGEQHYDVRLS